MLLSLSLLPFFILILLVYVVVVVFGIVVHNTTSIHAISLLSVRMWRENLESCVLRWGAGRGLTVPGGAERLGTEQGGAVGSRA